MTARTTALELQLSRSGRNAFVIVFEGLPLAFATTAPEDIFGDNSNGIAHAWEGTDWDPNTTDTSWLPCAFLPGAWSSQIDFLNPKIRSDSIAFDVLDRTDYLAGLVFGSSAATARTFLTADLSPTATTIPVQETAGFTASGDYYLYIGNETIKVNSANKTSTGWTSATRAQWSLYSFDGGAPFAPAHLINRINNAAPRVSDRIVSWKWRRCAIYMHHWEAGSKSWSSRDDALIVWEGLVENIFDIGGRALRFNCIQITELLHKDLLQDQFTAEVAPGAFIGANAARFYVHENIGPIGGGAVEYSFDITPQWYTFESLADAIRAKLNDPSSGLGLAWFCHRDESGRMKFGAAVPVGDPSPSFGDALDVRLKVVAHDTVWFLLGWIGHPPSTTYYDGDETYTLRARALGYIGTGRWQNVADRQPVKYMFLGPNEGRITDIHLENVSGRWAVQPQPISQGDGIPDTVEGFMQFGDLELVGGTLTLNDGARATFTALEREPTRFTRMGFTGAGGIFEDVGVLIRDNEISGNIRAKQVWYERRPIGETLLRLLLSTGYGDNDPDYDVNPSGMGAALPRSLVDVDSFASMGSDLWPLLVTKPDGLARRLESALATFNRYLVWKRGRITLVEPRVDGPTIAVAFVLNEDNKAKISDRAQPQYAADGIVNRIEVRFDHDFNGTPQGTLAVDDVVSQSDFGKQRVATIDAWGVQSSGEGLPAVVSQLAGKVLAYFSRPMTVIERTISKALVQISAGDTVLITDPYIIDPRTGRRGVVNFPAWVMAHSFEPSAMEGKIRLAYSPEFPSDKICSWAWSARVTGYTVVDPSNRYITVDADEYAAVGGANDDTWPAVGDKIRIRQLSPTDPYAPQYWQREIASIDLVNHRIYLTAVITGFDGGLVYVVTPDITTNIVNAQRVNTYIADDTTDTTGYAANDSYVLGTTKYSTPKPLVIQGYCRPARDGHADGKGYPLAVADVREAARSVNTLLSHRTRHLIWSQVWSHARATAGAGAELLAGPIGVPLYAYGARDILIKLYADITNGTYPGIFRITASRQLPQGAVGGPLIWPGPAYHKQVLSMATVVGKRWLDEVVLDCDPEPGREPPMIYITVEGETGNVGGSARLWGVSMFEDVGAS